MTKDSVQRFPICDMFTSIQGEGSFSGRPMIFIRVWGCPLSCPWCDEPRHRDPTTKQLLTLSEILSNINRIAHGLTDVVLTGGEPLAMTGVNELILALQEQGYWVAMESSGLGGPLPKPNVNWFTLSPKTPLPETLFLAANEVKFILGKDSGSTTAILNRAATHPNVWVQPMANGNTPDPEAVARCVALTLTAKGRLRLSLQMHKYIGIS